MGKWDNRMLVGKKYYLSAHQPQKCEIVSVGNQDLTKSAEATYIGNNRFVFKDAIPFTVFRWWRTGSKRFSANCLNININRANTKILAVMKDLGIE